MHEEERNIVFGRHPVMELLKSGKPVEKIFVHKQLKGQIEIDIRTMTNEACIPLVRTEVQDLNRLTGGRNHQGIVAVSSPIAFQDIELIVPHLYENDRLPLILILDHVKDVRNFGAIARSAEVLGVQALIIPKKGTAAINEDAIKTSAGALFKIPVCRVSNLAETMAFLAESGITLLATNGRSESTIEKVDFNVPCAIVIGSEGKGVQYDLIKKCHNHFKIPQLGETESLNVSVATGIILYEVMRQRAIS